MSADKYLSIFSRQMAVVIYIFYFEDEGDNKKTYKSDVNL